MAQPGGSSGTAGPAAPADGKGPGMTRLLGPAPPPGPPPAPGVESRRGLGEWGHKSLTMGTWAAGLVIQALHDYTLGDATVHLGPGQEQTQDQGVLIPRVSGSLPDSAPMSVLLVLDPKGMVYGSSYEGRYQPGSRAANRLPKSWHEGP